MESVGSLFFDGIHRWHEWPFLVGFLVAMVLWMVWIVWMLHKRD